MSVPGHVRAIACTLLTAVLAGVGCNTSAPNQSEPRPGCEPPRQIADKEAGVATPSANISARASRPGVVLRGDRFWRPPGGPRVGTKERFEVSAGGNNAEHEFPRVRGTAGTFISGAT